MKVLHDKGIFSIEGITVINPEVLEEEIGFFNTIELKDGDSFDLPENIIAEKIKLCLTTEHGADKWIDILPTTQHLYDTSDKLKEVYRLKLKEPLVEKKEITFCKCKPEDKHGSTTAWHCNHCGHVEKSETWLASSPEMKFNGCYIRNKIGCHCTDSCGYEEVINQLEETKEPLVDTGSKEEILKRRGSLHVINGINFYTTDGIYVAMEEYSSQQLSEYKQKLKAEIEKYQLLDDKFKGAVFAIIDNL